MIRAPIAADHARVVITARAVVATAKAPNPYMLNPLC